MVLLLIDECDFVAAKSEDEAIEFYKNEIGLSDEEFGMLSIEQIPSEKWEEMKVFDLDADHNEDEELKSFTMNELVDGLGEDPGIVASTEF